MASKKNKKPKRSKRKTGAAKTAPVFSRAKPIAHKKTSKAKTGAAWTSWGKQRVSGSKTEEQRRHVVRMLRARGVYEEIIEQIVYGMEPDTPHMLRIWGYASSDPHDPGEPGDTPVLQAMFVGSGVALWSRAIGYASKAPIEYVEIEELDGAVIDRPLWGIDSVETISGETVYGHGTFEEYRDRLKEGRPKKAGGGMTAAERRADRRRKNAAVKRKTATNARIEKLKKSDPIAAQRLKDRSKRSRKIIP